MLDKVSLHLTSVLLEIHASLAASWWLADPRMRAPSSNMPVTPLGDVPLLQR
jgi:hypothetical protein